MIEIIKKGNTKKQISCYYCESELEFEKSDIKSEFVITYQDFSGTIGHMELFIICPVCNTKLTIK